MRPIAGGVLRVAGVVVIGYFCVAMTVTLLAKLIWLTGASRPEAVYASAMTGFLLYPVLIMWGFTVRNLCRLYAALGSALVVTPLGLWLLP